MIGLMPGVTASKFGGTPTPTPVPTLVATPATPSVRQTIISNTLVADIANVPANVTPTISPNDGRFKIAGNAVNGWRVEAGRTALSAGTANFTIAATGATSVVLPITVTAGALPAAPTIAAVSCDAQWQATITDDAGAQDVQKWALYSSTTSGGTFQPDSDDLSQGSACAAHPDERHHHLLQGRRMEPARIRRYVG